MGQPTWRDVASVSVPERPGAVWTVGLDYVTPGHLYRIRVEAEPAPSPTPPQPPPGTTPAQEQTWQPESAPAACTADGDTTGLTRTAAAPLPDVAVGALIARIGGSTADRAGDKDKTVLFAVGRHCVFQAPDPPKTGALYLGVNDTPSSAAKLTGRFQVKISEAL